MSSTNIGGVVSNINALVTAANGSTPVPIGTLPPGALIRRIDFDVSTAFNGASGAFSVGPSGSATAYVSSGSVTTSGRASPAWNANWGPLSTTADTPVYATYTGSASASGSARIDIDYVTPAG